MTWQKDLGNSRTMPMSSRTSFQDIEQTHTFSTDVMITHNFLWVWVSTDIYVSKVVLYNLHLQSNYPPYFYAYPSDFNPYPFMWMTGAISSCFYTMFVRSDCTDDVHSLCILIISAFECLSMQHGTFWSVWFLDWRPPGSIKVYISKL